MTSTSPSTSPSTSDPAPAPPPASQALSSAELCRAVRDLVPPAVGTETWYLLIATVLVASPDPASLGDFWTHLTAEAKDDNNTRSTTPTNQPLLSLRLRDVLLKLVTALGAPPVIVAVGALAKSEAGEKGREEVERQAEGSVLSEKWKDYAMRDIEARGQATINRIYGPTLLPSIFAGFGAHKRDIVHMEVGHVYGLYLSDHSVLNAIESEVVVLTAILCTGLRGPALWHLRGLGRLLGARGKDAEEGVKDVLRGVKMAAMQVVQFCGVKMEDRVRLQEWPNVGDVSRELAGFGDDPFREEEKKEVEARPAGEVVVGREA